ncbi:DUF2625 family protein [Uliginosibacterium sp. H3]|uniref:DUF2625 family protein n=1 Tax=Uliginosibacterium silvisoli TaxID=3114758 RepID=A0ABU6K7R4_9RHOO|nr:DUF2625 family protein [Uliginosibacterium sp. H3]
MRDLHELIDTTDSAITVVRECLESSENQYEVLPPSGRRDDVLLDLQVSTRSTLGAVAYETGGILIDHGWLRILGSGSTRLTRDLAAWNKARADGFVLIADDAVGGFFAINSNGLGDDAGAIYYWAPDTLEWEPLGAGYTDFLCWALTAQLGAFYENLRWPGWQAAMQDVSPDECFSFYPFLWTSEGSVTSSLRKAISAAEQYAFNGDMLRQLRQREMNDDQQD